MSLAQLSRILPLPEEDLQQILDYASTLTKEGAVEHFNGVLGESAQALEFISSFNAHRKAPGGPSSLEPAADLSEVPRSSRTPRKKKPPLHTPEARPVHENYVAQGRAYKKDDDQVYMGKRSAVSNFSLQRQPDAVQAPVVRASTPHAPPSAAGPLISDLKAAKPKSNPASRNASPAPGKSAKIHLTGGMPMHGASTALSELDSAIRSLEIATNPTKQDNEARKCNCIATRHPLLAAAPNCLNCGKIVCVKEGLGPCTSCGAALLSGDQIQGMIRSLKDERGRERMAVDAASHRRAEVSRVPAPFSNPRSGGPTPGEATAGMTAAEIQAKEHRDRLLGFQAQNAKRTTVHDEASDFETPDAGTNMWSSVDERARQLKRQQKILREQEWNARPDYEKRRAVVSIDLQGRRIVRTVENVQRPKEQEDEIEEEIHAPVPLAETSGNANTSRGAFSRNPLLGGLIKPVWNAGKGKDVEGRAASDAAPRRKAWRRVQDDYDDNEEIILDGGAYGERDAGSVREGFEEHAQG